MNKVDNKKYDLKERMINFAASVLLFTDELPNNFSGKYYAHKPIRSGASVPLNFGELQGSNTSKDFINKALISLKESRINLKIHD